ncbi:hypothetical protein [Streptomyces canus]|uniref:hypothetical protein n=1 Tax=Streptomyces canus TaxID=58343 RepID=UPI002251B914|nr:hypothetical protein [Streptomyces canus]MCX4860758.1 hypothetical protein [Streptomyces canus]
MDRTGRRMTGPQADGFRAGTEPEVPPSRAGDAWSADGAAAGSGASAPLGADVRAADGPIMTGDVLDGRRVIGFGCTAHAVPTSADDRLLLEGDEPSGPPSRSTDPARHPALERAGRHPYAQLEGDRVHHADDLAPGLTGAFDELIHGVRGPRFLAPLIDRFAESGHGFWLSGGAPRDLLSGFRPDEVGDLDATGTAPAGAFCDLAEDVLEQDGSSAECPRRFSPDSLVCSVLTPRRDGHVLDYRGLGVRGLPYPATGTDLDQDGRQRDLTVNTLLYDPRHRVVVDPLGRALRDLPHRGEGPRRLVLAGEPEDPETCAELLLRALKFLLRWQRPGDDRAARRQGRPLLDCGAEEEHGLDDSAVRAWADALPADLVARLDERGEAAWRRLRAQADACLPGGPGTIPAESVRGYGPVVAELLARITGPGA